MLDIHQLLRQGIANTNGQMWIDNRRFALRQLKDLGMGKTQLEQAIQYEAVCLVEDFKRHTGRPGPPPASITVAVLNVIWKLAAGIPHFLFSLFYLFIYSYAATKKRKRGETSIPHSLFPVIFLFNHGYVVCQEEEMRKNRQRVKSNQILR